MIQQTDLALAHLRENLRAATIQIPSEVLSDGNRQGQGH